jgi:hypothetical protein
MKRTTRSLLLLYCLCLLGCRTYHYERIDKDGTYHGLTVRVLLSDAKLAGLELQVETNVVLKVTGYTQDTDEKALQSIAAGVAEGVTKGLLSKP